MKNNYNILFCGDINVDLVFGNLSHPVQDDKEVLAETFSKTVGSSAVITAAAFASLGGKCVVSGLRGNDENGLFMDSKMKEFGIDTRLVQISDSVKTGITVNLNYGRSRSQVTYPGTISEYTGPDLGISYSQFSHVHFTGIYQQTSFLPNLVRVIKHLKEQGLKISLDTQWDAQEKWEYLEILYPLLDVLFINEDEALSISNSLSIHEATLFFKNRVKMTVLKMGAQGALIITENGEDFIPIYPATVIDTIGAGDTFSAAFIYSHEVLNKSFIKSAHFASAASARSCQFPGGVEAKSSYTDIINILESHNVQF
ncbi:MULTISPECIES: carbohydrate kinase family protein [unclassified Oceanispirochaeta]|uniref:carbohydrate kinase family protein n=1 Tax=unclassified Oceanispirochaeta TaxID=2635722 RepID=UPI001314708E|nr:MULTISPECIES: PfkB family carbohydrate kinase [unclassified Oceanispirochaeta]MBF9014634.1 hypothetical protein [Oceanispirochaeta sp. M2]NPD70890.1 hypothetical protein [Oceanispirochaeta sp. M1]